MARVTGNYRRGNERTAKNHPRNARALRTYSEGSGVSTSTLAHFTLGLRPA